MASSGDHPRVCGEYVMQTPLTPVLLGSPPRVRGIHRPLQSNLSVKRITPACAGNTRRQKNLGAEHQDHPRVCGEYIGVVVQLLCKKGITPACAGNTFARKPPSSRFQDHPRVCGEYIRPLSNCLLLTGSPPRVRGIRKGRWSFGRPVGITPACAGNTCRVWS